MIDIVCEVEGKLGCMLTFPFFFRIFHCTTPSEASSITCI